MSDEEHEHEQETAAVPPEQEDRIVDKVVDKIKGFLGSSPAQDSEKEDKSEDTEPAKEPTTLREVEANAEALVREAVDKITAEEKHAKEHESLKKELERPPIQYGKVTRALWGEK